MDLPLSKQQAQTASAWMKQHFTELINEAIAGTPWTLEIVVAIAMQETAYKWIHWIDKYDAATVLARCVFDASGEPEFPQNPRSAFPKNRDVFKAHYGAALLNMLVEEGNKARHMQGWGNAPFLYKGWGIFQYDLQHIVNDKAFFTDLQWYSITHCLNRLVKELNQKAQAKDNLHDIVKCYNGSGLRAEAYANNVMQFAEWV